MKDTPGHAKRSTVLVDPHLSMAHFRLWGLSRYNLHRFGEGGRVHQRQSLGHGIVEVPAEDFPQPFLADFLCSPYEVAHLLVQRETCLVQYALVEGCIPVTQGHVILAKDSIQVPVQAVFNH